MKKLSVTHHSSSRVHHFWFSPHLLTGGAEAMRNWRAWLCVWLCAFVLAAVACVSGGNGNGGGGMATRHKKGPNEPVYIGFSMDTLKEERWQRDKELVEKHAKEVGAQLDVLVAN